MPAPNHEPRSQYKLNLPADLADEIRAAAEANDRSMNAEIISRLRKSSPDRLQIVAQILAAMISNSNFNWRDKPTPEREVSIALWTANALIAEVAGAE